MSGRAKRKTRALALTEVTEEENANVLKVESNIQPRSNGLNLSDSDDSSEDDTADENAKEKRLRLEKELEKKRKTQNKKAKAASKKSKAAVGVQLASLASIVEEEENLWKKKDDDDDDDELQDVLESPRKKLDNDVAQLLKMGEAEKGCGGEDSDDSEADLVDAGQASSQGEDEEKKEAAQGEKRI